MGSPDADLVPRWRRLETVAAVGTITQVLLAAAAGWYLLGQLSPIIRPLFVAIFLAYILMPYHARLRRSIGSPASIGVLVALTAGVLVVLALATYASMLGLRDDMPRLQARAGELIAKVEGVVASTSPEPEKSQSRIAEIVSLITQSLVTGGVDVLLEACVVAMYLLFLLLEGSRFPDRVRLAYSRERAEDILAVAGQVSSAIVSYLRAKVKASLVLALPVGAILWACDVKFALLWAVFTFLCNFIPYIGPVLAFTLPAGFAFLWHGVAWQPITAAALMLACHVASAAYVEPTIIGKAVGLSPLVLLASLAFWGLLWGLSGMFLAVPLTVVAIIVMDHFDSTRAVARLLRGG
ncbi:MAG TPA: AI-2E family transporter [Gemmata sp.]|nr:AI-2E family transporter [Gemmata sp.]